MKEEYLKKISLRRMVTVDDIAAMALFLCSLAGRNISGQAISVDGNVEHLLQAVEISAIDRSTCQRILSARLTDIKRPDVLDESYTPSTDNALQ